MRGWRFYRIQPDRNLASRMCALPIRRSVETRPDLSHQVFATASVSTEMRQFLFVAANPSSSITRSSRIGGAGGSINPDALITRRLGLRTLDRRSRSISSNSDRYAIGSVDRRKYAVWKRHQRDKGLKSGFIDDRKCLGRYRHCSTPLWMAKFQVPPITLRGGLRLKSDADQSLVVKFTEVHYWWVPADHWISKTVSVESCRYGITPGNPVVLTSINRLPPSCRVHP